MRRKSPVAPNALDNAFAKRLILFSAAAEVQSINSRIARIPPIFSFKTFPSTNTNIV
jgi:hypothetical protein